MKNFAKHQNIKVKEKIIAKDKEKEKKNNEVLIKENLKNEIYDNEGRPLAEGERVEQMWSF